MPIQCASCGRQNPDGQAFCENCGSGLATAPAAAVAVTAAAPPPAYPMYQQAAVAGMPVHRTSSSRVLAIVGGLIGAIIVLFLAVTLVRGQSAPAQPPPAIGGGLRSPAPAGGLLSAPAQPAQSATRAQVGTAGAGQGTSVSNSVVSISSPPGWQVKKDDSSITVGHPTLAGIFRVEGTKLSKPQTLQQIVQSDISSLQQKYPDAALCVDPGDATIGGVNGVLFGVCYTFTPQGGQAIPVGEALFYAMNGAKMVLYFSDAFMASTDAKAFGAAVDPVVATVQWLLR